jgi:hypothetical protein
MYPKYFGFILQLSHYLRLHTVDGRMTGEIKTGKNLERNGRDLIAVITRNLPDNSE